VVLLFAKEFLCMFKKTHECCMIMPTKVIENNNVVEYAKKKEIVKEVKKLLEEYNDMAQENLVD
jgi:hypothetical protein